MMVMLMLAMMMVIAMRKGHEERRHDRHQLDCCRRHHLTATHSEGCIAERNIIKDTAAVAILIVDQCEVPAPSGPPSAATSAGHRASAHGAPWPPIALRSLTSLVRNHIESAPARDTVRTLHLPRCTVQRRGDYSRL